MVAVDTLPHDTIPLNHSFTGQKVTHIKFTKFILTSAPLYFVSGKRIDLTVYTLTFFQWARSDLASKSVGGGGVWERIVLLS
jgi:hypothetical protein